MSKGNNGNGHVLITLGERSAAVYVGPDGMPVTDPDPMTVDLILDALSLAWDRFTRTSAVTDPSTRTVRCSACGTDTLLDETQARSIRVDGSLEMACRSCHATMLIEARPRYVVDVKGRRIR